jgi:hypothetical protein
MAKLFEKLAQLEEKLGFIDRQLGIPQRKYLLVRNQLANKVPEDTLISAFITNVNPRLVGLLAGNVVIKASNFQVEIPRTSPLNLFIREDKYRATFLIDPPLNLAGEIQYSNSTTKSIEGATFCKLIHIIDSDPVIHTLILSKDKD